MPLIASLGKSPGPDGIQAEHICIFIMVVSYPLVLFLTGIFNAILITGQVPASFACDYDCDSLVEIY